MTLKETNDWLGLAIGNSRLHWAEFRGDTLKKAWDTDYLPKSAIQELIEGIPKQKAVNPQSPIPLYLASVVPSQTELWQIYPNIKVITLDRLPLKNTYPTLGIDRALAVVGAIATYNLPVLAIDAGTALTFTGADINYQLVGGAILPGLGVQFQSLSQKTAALPEIEFPTQLPPRWAMGTQEAIASGIIYTILAGIKDFTSDWQQQFPNTQIVLTGGNSHILLTYLQAKFPTVAAKFIIDPQIIFRGMQISIFG